MGAQHQSHVWETMDGSRELRHWCSGRKLTVDPECSACGCKLSKHTARVGHDGKGCSIHLDCQQFQTTEAMMNEPADAGDAATLEGLHSAIRYERKKGELADDLRVDIDRALEGMNERQQELVVWWVHKALEESTTVAAKALEYGGGGNAIDLYEIGRQLVLTSEPKWRDMATDEPTNQQFAELGIYFYVVGKMARWQAAVMEGRAVSDDTLYDIGVYIRMAQRVRQVGGWPNA